MTGRPLGKVSLLLALALALPVSATRAADDDDPDLPAAVQGQVDKAWYLHARGEAISQLLGLRDWVEGENPRVMAIEEMENGLLRFSGSKVLGF